MISVLAVLGAGLGGLYGMHKDDIHQASAVILINPLEGNPFSPDGSGDDLVNLETEAQLVTSDGVARVVAQKEGTSASIASILQGISVTVPPNTQILEISSANRSDKVAVERAQDFAQLYLDHRQARAQSTISDQAAHANEQIVQSDKDLQSKVNALTVALKGSPKALLLQQQVIQVTTQIGQLRTQLATLQATPLDPGQIVTPAATKSAGLLSMAVLGVVGGIFLGAAVGVAIAVARSRRDKRIKHPSTLALRDLPLLGMIPPPAPNGARNFTEIGRVRGALLAADQRRPLVVLVATSSPSHPARSAGELAVSLGRSNLEVIVVDTAGSALSAKALEGEGLLEVLLDHATPDDVLKPYAPHVWRISPGTQPDRLDDLVAAPEMTLVVQELRKRADIVLLSGGPMTQPRTQSLIRLADAILIEVSEGVGTLDDVDRAVHDLEASQGELTGLVYLPEPRRPRRIHFRGSRG